jgi:putative flippase GtrA
MSIPPLTDPQPVAFRPPLRLRSEHVRYLAVGGWNTAFAYAVFAGLHLAFLSLNYMVVLLVTHAIGTMNAFLTYRYLVFRVSGTFFTDLARFALVYVGAITFNLVALPVLVEGAGLDVLLVQGLIVSVTVVSSYLGHKHFSFRRPATGEQR